VKIINGREVVETDAELVDPEQTALVLIDIQNDYVSPEGLVDRLGYDIAPMRPMVAAVRRLIDAAHDAGILVVYIQDSRLPGNLADSGPVLRFITLKCAMPANVTEVGSWGWQICDELQPDERDVVLPKYREGAFVGTALDTVLRSNRVRSVVMCGDVTHGCLESSARDALLHDYYVVVCEDGVAGHVPELHEASMTVMRTKFDVLSSAQIIALWAAARRTDDQPDPIGAR
jgi:nicotinamidase-related amidase